MIGRFTTKAGNAPDSVLQNQATRRVPLNSRLYISLLSAVGRPRNCLSYLPRPERRNAKIRIEEWMTP